MICVTIQGKGRDEIFSILDRPEVEMAEIRLDRCPLTDDDISDIFSGTDKPLIATYRCGNSHSIPEHKLSIAVEAGAKYLDLELEAPAPVGKRLARKCREEGVIMIRSYHNFDCTPSKEELEEIVERCHRFGGELVKIAVKANDAEDVARVKALYKNEAEGQLVAFCMGETGKGSRMQCLGWGSPFTYASLAIGEEAADGQIPYSVMADELYQYMPCPSDVPVRMPASKSFAQRAIVAAALAEGTSCLSDYSSCEDSEAAIGFARSIGAEIRKSGSKLFIKGRGYRHRAPEAKEFPVGESGLLSRLAIPILARLCNDSVSVTGSGTLRNRPLSKANDIMAAFGVVLTNLGTKAGKEVFVPLKIDGKLLPGRADISGSGGSQLISGLLMALPLAEKNSAIFVHEPRSIPYMFITLDVLRKFGIQTGNEMEGDDEFIETQDWSLCTAINFKIKGNQIYKAADFSIEADWSAAAPFMVAAAIFGGVHIKGLDTSSLQADLSVMDVLIEAGASVSQDDDGTVNVFKAPLNSFSVDLNNAPDLFPTIAVLAAFCPGENRITGLGRLTGKESNRAKGLVNMLSCMGVDVDVEGDELIVSGHSLSWRIMNGEMLHGGKYSSSHDHRMVMALSVASLGSDSEIIIDDVACVKKSYPDFKKTFDACFRP